LDDKKLDEESYRSFLKSYGPDWDMRFGVYYEDGWHYVYRSNFLLKKFKFQKQDDGFYHVIESYTTESGLRHSATLFTNFVQGECRAQLAEAMLSRCRNSCTQKNIVPRVKQAA